MRLRWDMSRVSRCVEFPAVSPTAEGAGLMFRTLRVIGPVVLLGAWASIASAQTTYHLHNEASSTTNLKQLKSAFPDVASVALQTANLKSTANGEKLIKEFDT